MSLTKRIGFGLTLGYTTVTPPITYTLLGNIVDDIDGPDAKADEIETALLTDHYKTKTVGQWDPGHYTFQIAYDPADAGTTVITGWIAANSLVHFQILYPIIGSESQQNDIFDAYVCGFKKTGQKQKMIVAEITLMVTGNPGGKGM